MFSDNYNNVSRQGPLVLTDSISDPQNSNFGIIETVAYVVASPTQTTTLINLPAKAVITQIDVMNGGTAALAAGTTLTLQKVNQQGGALSPVPAPLLTTGALTTTISKGTSFNVADFTNQDTQLASQCALRATLSSAIPANAQATILVHYFMNQL